MLTPLQTVTPGRFGPMMMADGEFMCAECVVENKDRINEAADSDGSVIELAQWASVGYCGDKVKTGEREVKRDGKTRSRRYVVNSPKSGDRCSHCGRAF